MSRPPRHQEPRTEFELIAWLRRRLPSASDVVLGVGDDAAQVRVRGESVLFCTDTLLEGVHFHLEAPKGSPIPAISPRQLGHKALAVNLSDLAAMGAEPLAAVVALTLRRGMPFAVVRGFFEGLLATATRHDTPLCGGDTTAWDGPLAVTVSLLGLPCGTPVRRRGGKPGDRILVTGALGGAILGHHARFTPRLREARYLMTHARPRAMIDISDGFVQDLGHLLEDDGLARISHQPPATSGCRPVGAAFSAPNVLDDAHGIASARLEPAALPDGPSHALATKSGEKSGLGARVFADAVPISAAARHWAKLTGRSPRDHALSDGEDFELCFLLAPPTCARLLARNDLPCRISEVGVVSDDGALRLEDRRGRELSLPSGGYDHLAARSADPALGKRR